MVKKDPAPLSLDSTVVRTSGLMTTPVDRDFVILNPARDNYVGLDVIGRRIWEFLAVPCRISELCLRIAGEFPGDSREIATDILAFLNELASEGLLVGVQDGLLSQRE
jgi:hypothetical protein